MKASRFDSRALLVWLVCALAVTLRTSDTGVKLVLIAAAISIAMAGKDLRIFRIFMTIGAFTLITRTMLFAIATRFASRSILDGIVEGVTLLTILCMFGAFLSNTDTSQLLRLVPRSMFEAGLILNIALNFAPRLSITAIDVRDAHKMRGGKGHRKLALSAAMPMLATALDRSINLAEAMDSRGYGFTHPARPPITWRNASAASTTASATAAALWSLDKAPMVSGPLAIALVCFALFSMHKTAGGTLVTRYRRSSFTPADWSISMVSFLAVILTSVEPRHHVGAPMLVSYFAAILISMPAWISALAPTVPLEA